MAKRHRADFSHSMTDLMASVAVTFLLLAAIFIVKSAEATKRQLAATKKELVPLDRVKLAQEESRKALAKLVETLRSDTAVSSVAQIVPDASDPFLLTITYRSEQLTFATDQSVLRDTAKKVVDDSFPTLIKEVCANEAKLESVTLEGHTDAQGGEDRFQYNFDLSARRALAVFSEGRESILQSSSLRHCMDSTFIVTGRGPVRPSDATVRWDDWERRRGSRTEDRRVEVKVRFSAGEAEIRNLQAKP
jgi:outer membrane protein OmpA-like peptidoglycan-associated protein